MRDFSLAINLALWRLIVCNTDRPVSRSVMRKISAACVYLCLEIGSVGGVANKASLTGTINGLTHFRLIASLGRCRYTIEEMCYDELCRLANYCYYYHHHPLSLFFPPAHL